jgi:hypothetical protein
VESLGATNIARFNGSQAAKMIASNRIKDNWFCQFGSADWF